MSVTQRCVRS